MIPSTLLVGALLTVSVVSESVGRTVDWARLATAVRQYALSPNDRTAAGAWPVASGWPRPLWCA
jgi:hypothetical protein